MIIRDVFEAVKHIWRQGDKDQQIEVIYSLCGRTRSETNKIEKVQIEKRMYSLLTKLQSRWQDCKRTEAIFLNKHSKWLDGEVLFFSQKVASPKSVGRPPVPFEELSIRTKRRRVADLTKQRNTQELLLATASSMHAAGNRMQAKQMLQEFLDEKCSDLVEVNGENRGMSCVKSLTPDEAVSFMVQNDLSKDQYTNMRLLAIEKNAKALLPSYHKVLEAKTQCYPPASSIEISERSMTIQLQSLMDHTVSRICHVAREVIQSFTPDQLTNVVLISKWGLDGSGGHSQYKQRSEDDSLNDSHLVVTSVVPLQLYSKPDDGSKLIIWQNPRPGSPRFCRPIRIQFEKETSQLLIDEVNRVNSEIEHLAASLVYVDGHNIAVQLKMHITMIDGKVRNAVTLTKNSQACYICQAKASDMNKLDEITQRPIKKDALKLGLPVLHTWIRAMEYLLHVTYRLDVKTWQCRSPDQKEKLLRKKSQVQRDFKLQLGLLIDAPKQGFGSSNDGNTARRFFENTAVTASITGLNEDLLERFKTLLSAAASCYEIRLDEFEWYATETAYRCVELYPWYNLPPSIHVFLIHGVSIIKAAALPIGMYAEDAQESQHKNCKRIRTMHTRKISREHCNIDLLHACLITSDPLITSLRKLPAKRSGPLAPKVLALLKEPSPQSTSFDVFEESDEE